MLLYMAYIRILWDILPNMMERIGLGKKNMIETHQAGYIDATETPWVFAYFNQLGKPGR